MLRAVKQRRFLLVTVCFLFFVATAIGQAPNYYSVPTGHKPLGVAAWLTNSLTDTGYAVVANSGDNSVSIFKMQAGAPVTLSLSATVTGIPSPYAVAACPTVTSSSPLVLVTSPSDNSVSLIDVGAAKVLGTVKTGSQPYSVACYQYYAGPYTYPGPLCANLQSIGIVSNLGDSSVVAFLVPSLVTLQTFQGVPGSRGFHGIAFEPFADCPGSSVGVVAGTDANTITVLPIGASSVVQKQLTFAAPTAVSFVGGGYPPTFWAASGPGNSLFNFEPSSGNVKQIIQNVPNPDDAFFEAEPPGLNSTATRVYAVATNRPAAAISWTDDSGNARTIPGIPQPASVAILDSSTTVLVTSTSTDSLYIVYLPLASAPHDFTITNGATFQPNVAPGSVATAFAGGSSQPFYVNSLPLPTTLGGATLNIGGTVNWDFASNKWVYSSAGSVQAPLSFVGPDQTNFQVPPGIATGNSVPVQLVRANGTSSVTVMNVVPTSPGIFTFSMNGQGQGAVLNQDNSPNGPTIFPGAKAAPRGGVIQIFATGAGATNPPMQPGQAADPSGNPLVFTQVQPTVTIGGIQAQVYYSIMAPGYPGVWQIDAQVPTNVTPGSAVPLTVSAGGVTSNTVTIAVE